MSPLMGVCLCPCGGGTCAPMAMGGTPPESQLSWRSGRYLIVSDSIILMMLVPVRCS
jgi:hypothetical protein